ncbi:calmodulin binding protein PICBP [Lactuca sativa]|uniref:Calmodulin-binding domain-containing protein n=1 Tax=Lactuca sativa TaxID=4236 RepID=A0A9R1UPI2_LACSA|nr:calmodulin binding protein PICBP [Lactuca sativa]KAJ0190613.1 hypothetical protein LSAT_V11C800421710 [Lactuca sativa]
MATVSSLTKGVRRTGARNKSQLEWPSPDSNTNFSSRKGSNQGDSDSDITLFTSSMHGSTSTGATSSIDRYSSGMEGKTQRKKTLDKSSSKKRWSFRFSKRSPQPPSLSLPDDSSATTRHPSPVKVTDEPPVRKPKPVLKITRSGSLRSLKIVRSKSKSSSESKGPTVEDLRSNRATFSSILKDSKFAEQVEPQVGVKEYEEILPVAKLCPYQHCSLHGHHHHHEPPGKRFSFLKRRSSKDQKGVNPKTPTTVDKPSGKKTEVKVTKKGSNLGSKGKKIEKPIGKDADFSIEFYAKTRTEHVPESSSGLDDADLANMMFGVNGNNQKEVQNLRIDDQESSIVNIDKKQGSINRNQMNMWRLIQRRMVSDSDLVAESGCELEQQVDKEQRSCNAADAMNQEYENRKMFVIKIVREAIQKVLLPEVPDQSITNISVRDHQKEPNPGADELMSGTQKGKPDGWSHIKKVTLLRRFITELEKVKRFNPNPLVPKSAAETVSLRPQTVGDKKISDDWMLDYALQQAVSELSPSQKRKVALIVKGFESVAPKLDDSKDSSLTDENGDYKDSDEQGVTEFDSAMKSEKEKYINMWHMIYQHVVTDITSKVGSELLHGGDDDDDDEQEVKDQSINNEFSPRVADMLIRQSVNEILLPEVEEDASLSLERKDVDVDIDIDIDGGESQTQQIIPKNWNKLRTLRRSIKDLESSRKLKPETPRQSAFHKEEEQEEREQVDLRRQKSHQKTKAEQWMIDYAVQHIVTKLTPARKKRVSMLVEAFEAVIPLPET